MATTNAPDTTNAPAGKETNSGEWTKVTLAIVSAFAALVAGIGIGWLAFRDTGPDVPSDVQTLIDDYGQAWQDGDGETAVGLMTPGARFVADSYVSEGGISGDALATHIETSPTSLIELGDIESITGDLPYVIVRRGNVSDREAIGVTYIVEDGGELKISAHSWFD